MLGPLSDGLSEIYQFKVEGKDDSLMQLRSILDWQVAPQLKQVPGITEVNVNGGELKTYEVRVAESALTRFGLSIEDIYAAVAQNNRATGGATIARNVEQAVIGGEGLLESVADIGNIVLRTAAGGSPLYVKNVAEVVEAPMPRLGAVTSQGNGQAVVGVALMTLGENTRVVAQRLGAAVEQINKTLPPGVSIVPYYNRADLIDRVWRPWPTTWLRAPSWSSLSYCCCWAISAPPSSWRWRSRSRCWRPSPRCTSRGCPAT